MAHGAEESDAPKSDDVESAGGSDEKLLAEAHARLKLASEAEQDIRTAALEDMRFRAGDQWPEAVKQARAVDSRPCLVINRMPQFIQQVTNDQRQNRPSIKAHPVDDLGDVETAKIIQGLIRHIEYDSNADVAYDTAFEGAVVGGFGYFRVVTEFESPTSFNQVIKIKRVRNPFSVFFDPHSEAPDGHDAEWAFVVDDLSKDEYKAKFPASKLAKDSAAWEAIGNTAPDWMPDGGARVAEHFYRVHEEREIVLLDDGQVIPAADLAQAVAMGRQEVDRRTAVVPVVKWCKLNALEILEKRDWPGIYIPIIPVYGTELYIDGKRTLEGIVRNAKDSQRMYNYWKSAETEAIALAPRTPWIVAEGQLEGHEAAWATANTRNHAYLPYKTVSVGGQPVGPPQRNSFEPAIGAITQASMGAAEDLKATTGIYDASLGGRSNETSGVAIQRRNQQAQTSNFHFVDNLTRSIKHGGRVIIDLLPHIYDTARASRIVGDDGEQKVVKLNQDTGSVGKDGRPLIYALDTGRYDVTVDVGPSYASKRQEASAAMIELTKSMPAIGQAAPDIILKAMDVPGASDLAERMKKTLPPGLADGPAEKKAPIPPQVQAQMAQMGQMIDQLTKQVNESADVIQNKRIELESRERIEMAKIERDYALEMARLDAKDSLAILNHQINEISARQALLSVDQPIADVTADNAPPAQPMQPQAPGEMSAPSPMMDGAPSGAGPMMGAGPDPAGGESPGAPMEPM